MRPLEAARAHVRRLLEALAEGDFELACLVLEELDDDLLRAERDGADHRRHVDHCCVTCESDCDRVTALRCDVVLLQNALLVAAWQLREAREINSFAVDEIERKFPGRAA